MNHFTRSYITTTTSCSRLYIVIVKGTVAFTIMTIMTESCLRWTTATRDRYASSNVNMWGASVPFLSNQDEGANKLDSVKTTSADQESQ